MNSVPHLAVGRRWKTIKGMRSFFAKLVLLVGLSSAWGCGSRSPAQVAPAPPPVSVPVSAPEVAVAPPQNEATDCQLISPSPDQDESVASVALTEPIDPAHAPYPTNDSERLLFRQVYEALIRVDCQGLARPALAGSWRPDAGGQTWLVTLREGARFADGVPVTSQDVLSAWSLEGAAGPLRPQVLRLIRSAVAVDNQTLAITLRTPFAAAPRPLAHTDLAISRRVPDSSWPVGTRAVTVAGTPSAVVLTGSTAPAKTMRFLMAAGRDGRDLLDEGVDLLVTREPRVLEYAATLPRFVLAPLEWQRTHVLLTPGRTAASPELSAEERESLAKDAVRGEARGAQGPFWWQSLPGCEQAYSPRARPSSTTGRIVYDTRDAVARDLAERLVGLVSAASPGAAAILDALLPDRSRQTYQRAAGLTGEPLVSARQRGDDAGYILELDRRPLDVCREMEIVVETARWVDPATIVPLVDTRLQAIVRRGRSGVATEWDGGLLLIPEAK